MALERPTMQFDISVIPVSAGDLCDGKSCSPVVTTTAAWQERFPPMRAWDIENISVSVCPTDGGAAARTGGFF
jgi:hypothetical protein